MQVKKLGVFTLLRYLNYFIGFIRSIVTASVLSVSGFGLWSYLNTVFSVLQYSNLGVDSYLNYYFSREENKGNLPSKTTNFITILISIMIVILLPILSYIMEWSIILEYSVWIVVLVVLKLFSINQNSILRHRENLNFIGFSEILFSIIMILPFLLSIFINYEEITDSALIKLALFLQILFLSLKLIYVNRKFKLNPFDTGGRILSVLSVLKISLILLSINALTQIVISIYRFHIEHKFGLEELGYFSFYFSLSYACVMALGAILWAKAPSILAIFEESREGQSRITLVLKYTRIYLMAVALVQILGYVFIYNLTRVFLVEYRETLSLFKEISKYQVVVSASYFYRVYFIANDKKIYVITGAILNLLMLFIIILVFSDEGKPSYNFLCLIAVPQMIYFLMRGFVNHKKESLIVLGLSLLFIALFSLNNIFYTILICFVLIVVFRKDFYALFSS